MISEFHDTIFKKPRNISRLTQTPQNSMEIAKKKRFAGITLPGHHDLECLWDVCVKHYYMLLKCSNCSVIACSGISLLSTFPGLSAILYVVYWLLPLTGRHVSGQITRVLLNLYCWHHIASNIHNQSLINLLAFRKMNSRDVILSREKLHHLLQNKPSKNYPSTNIKLHNISN